jgi:hypothetical protein
VFDLLDAVFGNVAQLYPGGPTSGRTFSFSMTMMANLSQGNIRENA